MGLSGAFLTGDLFNLYVFFEVLLAASYGLLLHGSGKRRVKAGLHYVAVNLAASMAFKEGFRKADPVLLEPIMKVEIVSPEDYLGDVMGDVSRRRGVLQGQDDSPSGKIINAMIPLGEMCGYATSLRSMSQGRATFSMEFDHYEEAPNNIAEQVIKKA